MNATKMGEPSACMTAGRRPVTVTVTILNDDPPEFEMRSSHLPVQRNRTDDEVLTFNNWANGQYSDGFRVAFELNDQTRKGYGFFINDPKDPGPAQAMSVRIIGPTGKCPRRGQQWDGFRPTNVSPDRQTLTVDNPNGHLQYFGFALHFSLEHQERPSLSYDPIGDNRNGNFQ